MLEAKHMLIYGVAQNEQIIPPSKRCGSLDTEAEGWTRGCTVDMTQVLSAVKWSHVELRDLQHWALIFEVKIYFSNLWIQALEWLVTILKV